MRFAERHAADVLFAELRDQSGCVAVRRVLAVHNEIARFGDKRRRPIVAGHLHHEMTVELGQFLGLARLGLPSVLGRVTVFAAACTAAKVRRAVVAHEQRVDAVMAEGHLADGRTFGHNHFDRFEGGRFGGGFESESGRLAVEEGLAGGRAKNSEFLAAHNGRDVLVRW